VPTGNPTRELAEQGRIDVSAHGRDTFFDVRDWPTRRLPLHVHSSGHGLEADLVTKDWRPDDLDAIRQRLGRSRTSTASGATKGRLIYVAAYYLESGYEIVAAALLRLPARRQHPIEIQRVGFSSRLNVDDRVVSTDLLLRCTQELALKCRRAGGRVLWAIERPADAAQLSRLYAFKAAGYRGGMQLLEWAPPPTG
jgi:hypothetical protein